MSIKSRVSVCVYYSCSEVVFSFSFFQGVETWTECTNPVCANCINHTKFPVGKQKCFTGKGKKGNRGGCEAPLTKSLTLALERMYQVLDAAAQNSLYMTKHHADAARVQAEATGSRKFSKQEAMILQEAGTRTLSDEVMKDQKWRARAFDLRPDQHDEDDVASAVDDGTADVIYAVDATGAMHIISKFTQLTRTARDTVMFCPRPPMDEMQSGAASEALWAKWFAESKKKFAVEVADGSTLHHTQIALEANPSLPVLLFN